MHPFGLLNIDKPSGLTSRDVVNRIQRLVRPAKAGHAGTLDPLATGVLVVCVGPATRLIEYVQQQAKRYQATFLLGRHSETDDVEGDVEMLDAPCVPTREALDAAIGRFLGDIDQRPPVYSAIKVRGKRAYDLARKGQAFELPPRKVRIDELRIREYDYPRLDVEVSCGSGTYVRSIGRDLAEAVGTSAVMSQLCRTAIGGFKLSEAVTLEELDAVGIDAAILPPSMAVAHLPTLILNAAEAAAIRAGRQLAREDVLKRGEFAAFDEGGRLLAILMALAPGRVRPHRNFASPS